MESSQNVIPLPARSRVGTHPVTSVLCIENESIAA